MYDRIRLAFKVLITREIIVVTRGEQFSTFNNSNQYQDRNRIIVEVAL